MQDCLYAEKKLSLLSEEGMDMRIAEIDQMIESFKKKSHVEARESAVTLKGLIRSNISFEVFRSDALKKIDLKTKPDIIVTDVPYGNMVDWAGDEEKVIDRLLDVLYEICHCDTIIGLCMNKKQKVGNEKFLRLEKQQVGKRRFEILRKR